MLNDNLYLDFINKATKATPKFNSDTKTNNDYIKVEGVD